MSGAKAALILQTVYLFATYTLFPEGSKNI